MESLKKEAGSGILMGIVGVLLLGAIIKTLAMPVSAALKLGGVIFDIGVAGLAWVFLDEAIESSESDIYRAILAIAAAILVAFAW
ncbi:hypothetical membrane protein [Thermococcus kodakarensis KOD1]|uniref:Hypothetical membrane protein n=1 Tax=Thermococcus kodakarensis (strain ATCC BAA-918 / JCM 12380 / KOD1) TaxID=69014 RepID=Q5JDJ6_THEKO|nr:hypothetical protein [Thermococcus kodakarensis]WCN27408.1 hypothetical protein POG15_07310 [Thermococcus kodakarensis]WCN29698.1 hypothetical protein POG21_07305 [Thermococcus kodakarensis]BAD85626.1 hypothetical membrane protein [Thermococcus kodakarensis KOD1]